MSDMNLSIISGRLTKNPEARVTPSGVHVCDLSVASNRYDSKGNQYPSYVRVTVWNRQAEVLGDPEKGLKTGDTVFAQGVLVNDDFELTKGDPSTKTSGRMKIDNARVTILRRKNVTVKTEEEALAETVGTPSEPVPEV